MGDDSVIMYEHMERILAQLLLPKSILVRPFAVCSGGEQKRVAIAQELMSHRAPSLLFVDEPTTGLDSAAALEVVKCLQNLARTFNTTVVASIHTPNHEIVSLFHKLYVLAKGGLCIYSGPPGSIQQFLESEIQLHIREQQPPVEALLRVACNGIRDPKVVHLTKKCLTLENEQLKNQTSKLYLQAQGIAQSRKCFHLCDFALELVRFGQVTFISKWRTILFNVMFYIFYYILLRTLYDLNIAQATGCYTLMDQQNANCTNIDSLHDDNVVKKNSHYISMVYLMTGFAIICTNAVGFSSITKVFRSEHRNRKYIYISGLLLTLIFTCVRVVQSGSILLVVEHRVLHRVKLLHTAHNKPKLFSVESTSCGWRQDQLDPNRILPSVHLSALSLQSSQRSAYRNCDGQSC